MKKSEGQQHLSFGGSWTIDKLDCLKEYLNAYRNVLKNQSFETWYIDAFAGTGSLNTKHRDDGQTTIWDEIEKTDKPIYIDGSTRIALNIDRPFAKYIFIEKEAEQIHQLKILKSDFPSLADKIDVINEDCNSYLQNLSANTNWAKTRAVLFLDPYGMEVHWETLKAIAKTGAIDLWMLFPLGVAVNRMLTKDGQIPDNWVSLLNRLFGNEEWRPIFYKTYSTLSLFGEKTETRKVCDFKDISEYFVGRLKTIFPVNGVADNPKPLYNNKSNPLFLFCFASSNPGPGSVIAKRIAQHILKN